jgi:HK97 family phage major capsid protein
MEARGKSNPDSPAALGMSKNDTAQFSLARAINACATNDWKLAPFELDCSRQLAAKLNKPVDTQRFFVPFEVLQRSMPQTGRRDLTTQVPGDGGYLVATESQGFVEILRNRSVAFRMGARRLSGLNGNVTIPKQTGAGTAYWLATESTQATESQQAFQQIALTPKTASAYTEISRNLLLQSSPGAEGIVSDDLAQITALAVDLATLSGSGAAGQPTGIVNTSGIGSVTATSVDYAKVLEFQTDVATSNVYPARGGYVTTPAAAAILMAKQRFSSTDTPLWQGNVWDGTMVGFPAMSSNQMSAGMIFGDWSEVVVGEWGVLEIAVNPYANFQAGIIGVRAMYSVDVGVRRAFAFSYASSVTA